MQSFEVQDLKERIDELMRMVKEEGETIEVTDHGQVVARVIPASEPKQSLKKEDADAWAELKRIAKELEPYWPKDVDAVKIVRMEDASFNENSCHSRRQRVDELVEFFRYQS